ncbi:PTS transporter subunit EIIC [Subdoligranulum variabile]|uniref:PTS transporter subunit EIIC n=1 Tax=Subdoligranulum variabile TaxID=214851 RepID=UPI0029426AF2|nr:PTS transporter subunit EIIC [Subdoligranulum variabile]
MMKKFMNWLENSLTPAVQRFTNRPWVSGFSAGIVKCLPFILTGCLIFFYNVVQPYFPSVLPDLSDVTTYTFNLLALLVAFMMVYQLMGSLRHRGYQVVGGLTGICAYILTMKGTITDGVYSVTWNRFGPTGIVVSIVIGVYVSFVFHMVAKLNLFKNNKTLPEFVQEWIKNIIPIFLTILILKIVIIDFDVDLYPLVLKIFEPVQAIAQTYPGYLLVIFIPVFFYSLGISGWTWSGPRNAIFIPAQAANIAAVAAGGVATNLTTSEVCNGIALCVLGGMGCTLAFNIWLLTSKSKRLKTLGRVCIGPSIFNINEPVLYGAPMVFNPVLMVPMYLCTFVNSTIVWIVMRVGFLAIPTIELAMVATIPAPISTVMFTGDMRGILWWAVVMVLDLAIYYPFFKVFERQTLAAEAGQAAVPQTASVK